MTATRIWYQGLWENNPALIQLLGLCPLLAVSNSIANATALAIATCLTLLCSNIAASLLRRLLKPEIRIAVFVLVIASVVTSVELLVQAWSFELHQRLGIFLPLIVTNCAILARAEAFASKNPLPQAAMDGLAQGIGFGIVLILLGAVRELLAQGSLFARLDLLLPAAPDSGIQFFDGGLLLAALAPGAFICLGLMLALRNWLVARQSTTRGTSLEQG